MTPEEEVEMRQMVLDLAWMRALTQDGRAKSIRVAARLSLGEIGQAIGVKAPAVCRWENGSRIPRGEPAIRYAKLLHELERMER